MKCPICNEKLDGGLFGLFGRCVNPHCMKNHHHDHSSPANISYDKNEHLLDDMYDPGTTLFSCSSFDHIKKLNRKPALTEPIMVSPVLSGTLSPTPPPLTANADHLTLDELYEIKERYNPYNPYVPVLTVEKLLNEQMEMNKLNNKEIV